MRTFLIATTAMLIMYGTAAAQDNMDNGMGKSGMSDSMKHSGKMMRHHPTKHHMMNKKMMKSNGGTDNGMNGMKNDGKM